MQITYLKENIFDDLDIEDLDDSEISSREELELDKTLNNINKSAILNNTALIDNAVSDIVKWLQEAHTYCSDFFGFILNDDNETYYLHRDKKLLIDLFRKKIQDILLNRSFHIYIEIPLFYGPAMKGSQEKNYGKIIAKFLSQFRQHTANVIFNIEKEIGFDYSIEELRKNIIFDVIKIVNVDAVQYDSIEKKLYYQLNGTDEMIKFYFEDMLNDYLKNENIVFLHDTSSIYESLNFYIQDNAATNDKIYYDKLNHWIDNALKNQIDANKLSLNFRISAVNSTNSLNFLNYLADTIAPQADKFYGINVYLFTLMDREEQNKKIVHGPWEDAVKKIRATDRMSLVIH